MIQHVIHYNKAATTSKHQRKKHGEKYLTLHVRLATGASKRYEWRLNDLGKFMYSINPDVNDFP
jgi:hypothetical protein